VRALIVSNMWPSADRPALGTFVRDQVEALRRRTDVDVELAAFPPGGGSAYVRAIPGLLRRRGFDVVHAHFGLTAWPALAAGGTLRAVTLHGNDLVAPRSRRATLAVLPRYDLVAVPSRRALELLPAKQAGRAAVLPCGIDADHFGPMDRGDARRALGLDPAEPFALFPYDPARAVKRHDRALLAAGEHRLHTLGGANRGQMQLWFNAASVVLCPADWETFGMACVEALACDTCVIATPTGVHAEALDGVAGCLCEEFEPEAWRQATSEAIAHDEQRVAGRASAVRWSADAMAEALVARWRDELGTAGRRPVQG
jgi:teichuronic acid biosynthesis glycosyltransferase TuaC